eukprot:gene8399-9258_t
MTSSLEIIQPDDFHHHLRDGEVLPHVLQHAERQFKRIIAMPNLKPPVRTLADALAYRERILSNCQGAFEPLMTLYLTDNTSPEEVVAAHGSGVVYAVKYYPAGATTNSDLGVSHIDKVHAVLLTMEDIGLPLLIHGEVTEKEVDIFDREEVFIRTILQPLIMTRYPRLKVVMEHITTKQAVEFIRDAPANIVATITAHHLLYNRNDIFRGGVCPHMYCLPILKREEHRQALLTAATSGSPKFFLGTDSAPHSVENKESACGCAGIFTAHAAIELYAEAFESVDALDKLEGFASIYGQQFYGLPLNQKKVRLVKESWNVPETLPFGSSTLKPLRAGQAVTWKIESLC